MNLTDIKKKYPHAYDYMINDDFEHLNEATDEMLQFKQEAPELFDSLEDYDVNLCPPIINNMSDEESEMICYNGCYLCWQLCKKDRFKAFLENFTL